MKKNDVKKQEALKLRENGMKLLDIRDKTGLSKATIERLFKRNSLISDKLSKSHKNNETPQNKGEEGDKNVNSPIKSEVDDENVKSETEVVGHTFTDTNVIFDAKTGGFTMGKSEPGKKKPESTENADSNKGKRDKRVTSESHNIAGGGQQFKTSHKTEKLDLDIDAPDNILDNFFTRGMGETLLIGGLLTAGFLMKSNDLNRQGQGGGW